MAHIKNRFIAAWKIHIHKKHNMKQLEPNGGIPRHILMMMAVLAGFTVANLYYNQALLELISQGIGITQSEANLITVITQVGYALGLLFIVPMADMVSVRRITTLAMSVAAASALSIAYANNVWLIWGASLTLGLCSIMPQLYIPMATLYSRPENKSRNMGYVASGLLTGILSARVISGYVGEWLGWRAMFIIVAVFMLLGLVVTLVMMPQMRPLFQGTYKQLMRSVGSIFVSHPRIRLYSLRPALGFGSVLSVWSCLAFHLAEPPFEAGSGMVGMLALCGVVGAVAASGVGKYVPKVGILRMSIIGASCQLSAWIAAYIFGDSYGGIIAAIILADIGAQCQQISNQSGSLQQLPEATNRVNTIFMTTLFIGGSLGTLLSGIGWSHNGWTGVCFVGASFAILSLLLSVYDKMKYGQSKEK
jgi:predicted MFS family arabinose efflux permease